MVQKGLIPLFLSLNKFIHNPTRIFYIALGVMVLSLMIDGTLWNTWRLRNEIEYSEARIEELKQDTLKIEQQIKMSYSSEFIEQEARRRFELASEGDLVFVFPPNSTSQSN